MEKDNLRQQAEMLVETIKELVREGNVSRVMLVRNGEILVNIPMTAGVIGAFVGLTAAPFALLTTALVTFGLDCEILIEKADGSMLNLNETEIGMKLEDVKAAAKDKAKDVFSKKD